MAAAHTLNYAVIVYFRHVIFNFFFFCIHFLRGVLHPHPTPRPLF